MESEGQGTIPEVHRGELARILGVPPALETPIDEIDSLAVAELCAFAETKLGKEVSFAAVRRMAKLGELFQ